MTRRAHPWALAVLAIFLFPVYTPAMGLTYVDVKLSSITNGKSTYILKCLVDTGATDMFVPSKKLREIGVEPVGKMRYELADGKKKNYRYGLGRIELKGRITAGRAIFGPDDTEPLLGVTTLESTGFAVDPTTHTLKKLPHVPLKYFSAHIPPIP